MKQRYPLCIVITLSAIIMQACASVSVYSPPSASRVPPARIYIGAWNDTEHYPVPEIIRTVAKDMIALRTDFLIIGTSSTAKAWFELCQPHTAAVLWFSAPHIQGPTATSNKVNLRLEAELFECSTGKLLWRGIEQGTSKFNDPHLRAVQEQYAASLSCGAERYTAPVFHHLQKMVAALPKPILTDADIEEKIQLETEE